MTVAGRRWRCSFWPFGIHAQRARPVSADCFPMQAITETTQSKSLTTSRLNSRTIGLMASEVTTLGGVQAFMLRLVNVIAELIEINPESKAYLLSLNDSTESLRSHEEISAIVSVWGAARSKIGLIVKTLLDQPRVDVLLVGHVGVSPLAMVLKEVGVVRDYYVILHGIEAWKRLNYLERRALRLAKKVVATTKFTARECAKHNDIDSEHFAIIPLCVKAGRKLSSTTFRLNGGFRLLCVARQDATERYKGFEETFRALVRVISIYSDIHLNMVGQGNDQDRLKNVVRQLKLNSFVTFWNALNSDDLAEAYEQCDVFVMPSQKEGFGIVFLEAMKFGKPCIGGNHGGTTDVIEEGLSGYLVDYGDVEALANRILLLRSDEKLRIAMGQRAKERLEQKFSERSFSMAYRDLMQSDT